MGFYNILWFFLIYACIGWCTEVIFAAVSEGKFVNRGMLSGPVCPIYGFGVVLVILCLESVRDNLIILFVCSVILTSLLELATGFILEKFFSEKWWDYSEIPFNFHGYICLKFSIMWGLACVFVMKIVHPVIQRAVGIVPHTVGIVLLIFLYAALAADVVLTVITLLGLKNRFDKVWEIEKKLRGVSDRIGSGLSDETLSVLEKNDELKALLTRKKADAEESLAKYKESLLKSGFMHRRILKAFPHMGDKYKTSVDGVVSRLRTHLKIGNAEYAQGKTKDGEENVSDKNCPPGQEGVSD